MDKDFEAFIPKFWEEFRKTEICAVWVKGLTWEKLNMPTGNVVSDKYFSQAAEEVKVLASNVFNLALRHNS